MPPIGTNVGVNIGLCTRYCDAKYEDELPDGQVKTGPQKTLDFDIDFKL